MYKNRNSVGDQVFKTERKVRDTKKTKAATDFRADEISGELPTAVYLRMMAGASYLDIFMIYNVRHKQVYNCFKQVVSWINNTFSYPFVMA